MTKSLAALLAVAAAATLFFAAPGRAEDLDKAIPAPAQDVAATGTSQTAILAGGCFWGQQGVFEHVKGVTRVVAGYSGGTKATANYPDVTTEKTGHAESVQITFDPRQVSYGTLLRIFFSVSHDPTELNRQGPDEGRSYRSAIFTSDPQQAAVAKAYIAQLDQAHIFPSRIATTIEPATGFYPAEDYHQDFLALNPHYGYIVFNDLPKLAALKAVWPAFYRSQPVLLASR